LVVVLVLVLVLVLVRVCQVPVQVLLCSVTFLSKSALNP
jgi:hypothetical protein